MSSTTSDMSHRQKCIANVFIGVSPEYRIVLDTQLSFVQKLSHVSLFVTPWTAAYQASLSFTISQFSSIQSLSHVWLLVIPWNAAHQASLSITNSQSLLKLMSLNRWCHPTIILFCTLLLPPSKFPNIKVFSSESVLRIRWPKYWSFSFSISPSNEYSGLISVRMDWLDLLAVQRTLKSLLQHHSSKASILLCSVFFIVQLLHPYMTTGKTIALTRWTFVGKVMSLLFNMQSRLVITFFQGAGIF